MLNINSITIFNFNMFKDTRLLMRFTYSVKNKMCDECKILKNFFTKKEKKSKCSLVVVP